MKTGIAPNPFDQYAFMAQYVPAIIITIPAMLLASIFEAPEFQALFKHSCWFLVAKNISLGGICIVFLTHVVRLLGKYGIEHFLFKDGLKFPTTELLLWKTRHISAERKRHLHARIAGDYGIRLCTDEEERADEQEARLRAKDAIGQIRQRVGKGIHTRRYNIQYGLFRNLAGGTPLMLALAILSFKYVQGDLARDISWLYIGGAMFYGLVCLPMIRRMGKHYAEYLINEYEHMEATNE